MMDGERQFSQSEREIIDKQEAKARISFVYWSWRHQYELVFSYTYRDRVTDRC